MRTNAMFRTFIKTSLSKTEFKSLALLYQPLIGIESYALYQTLYNLSSIYQDEYLPHQNLFDILNIKRNNFIKYREKLEAVGILETYQSDNNYIYHLKKPLQAKAFLLDTILGTYLESEIGEDNVKILSSFFKVKKPVLNHFENVSKSFDDIYEIKDIKLLNIDYELEGTNGTGSKLIRNTIDYDLFVEKLPRAYQGPHLLNNQFKEQVLQVAYVYQFNIEQMLEVYANAHKDRKEVTSNQLNLQAKLLFEKNNKQIVVEEKVEDEAEHLKQVSHLVIVQKYVKPNFQGTALQTINQFISRNEIDPGVINVLLMFIFKNKDGILPHVNYLDKVWESWASNGVATVEDAIGHRNKIEQEWSKKPSYGKRRVAKEEPEWLDEYLDKIAKMEG